MPIFSGRPSHSLHHAFFSFCEREKYPSPDWVKKLHGPKFCDFLLAEQDPSFSKIPISQRCISFTDTLQAKIGLH